MSERIRIPAGAIVRTRYVPVELVVAQTSPPHHLLPEAVEKAYRRMLALGEGEQEWPCPTGCWRDDGRFVLSDGRNRYVAALMLGYTHLLVAWVDRRSCPRLRCVLRAESRAARTACARDTLPLRQRPVRERGAGAADIRPEGPATATGGNGGRGGSCLSPCADRRRRTRLQNRRALAPHNLRRPTRPGHRPGCRSRPIGGSMGLRDLFRRETREPSSLENPSADLYTALTGEIAGSTAAGISVSPESALRQTAVYACVRVIAEDIASLPFPVYRRDASSRVRVPDDPRWALLNDSPNPEMYAMELLETTIGHANQWGRGYQYIVFDGGGRPRELWPLRPDRTEPRRLRSGERVYVTRLDSGEERVLSAAEVIEVKAFMGLSPIDQARRALAVGVAAEEYAARFWANDARPGGVITMDERLDEHDFQEFKARWNAGHQGLKRSHLVGILTNGAKWQDVGIPPEDAQFLETRKFSVREVARLYRVPPHKIADLEVGSVSYASIAEQAVDYVVSTLRPWAVRTEQAIKQRLFNTPGDIAASRYPQILLSGLLRGDDESRYRAYSIAIMWGFMSRAEVRELDDLPFEEGLDQFLMPANMLPSGATAGDVLAAARHIGFDDSTVKHLSALMQLQGIKPDDPVPAANGNGSGRSRHRKSASDS